MIAHTAFLVSSRKLAPGVTAPPRRRKPSKGAEAYQLKRRPGELFGDFCHRVGVEELATQPDPA